MHTMLKRLGLSLKVGPPVLLLMALVVAGCGSLQLQQPENQGLAQAAQTHFQNAALSQTIVAERERLASVLEQELDLVARHTLALRDARLLFLINVGADSVTTAEGKISPWTWLEQDIKNRLVELKLGTTPTQPDFADALATIVGDLSVREDRLKDLEADADLWLLERAADPSLPFLSCPLAPDLANLPLESLPSSWSGDAPVVFEDYRDSCDAYQAVATVELGNADLIRQLRAAQAEADRLIGEQARAFSEAQNAFFTAQAAQASSEIADEAAAFLNTFATTTNALGTLPETFEQSLGLQTLHSALVPLGMGSIVEDLKSKAVVEHLKAERAQVLGALQAIVNAGSTLAPDAQAPASALEVVSLLATAGKAVETAQSEVSVSDLQIQAEELRLDIVAAEQRKAFFDAALVLLEEDQAAMLQEVQYLNRALRYIAGIDGPEGCLRQEQSIPVARVFETEAGVDERCRERVFRALVAYSNAWTFGRVPQEQNYYRRIALHHEASLDRSEVALARWENVLGVPINQLAALYSTGTRPADVVSLVSSVASTVGLGIIALGVNR